MASPAITPRRELLNASGVLTEHIADSAVTTAKLADGAVTAAKMASGVLLDSSPRYASGASTSTAPGTTIASITATPGYSLVAWSMGGTVGGGGSSEIRATITYSDATTETIDLTYTGFSFIITAAAVVVGGTTSTAGFTGWTGIAAGKKVTGLKLATLNTGSGSRVGVIAAWEVGL